MKNPVAILIFSLSLLISSCSTDTAQAAAIPSDTPESSPSPATDPDEAQGGSETDPAPGNDNPPPDGQQPPADFKILFVGNSLTYENDLPQLVEEVAREAGTILETETLAYPNYGLEDHWADGKVQKRIEAGGFDFVVIQQGPSSQAYGRESLITYGGLLKKVCDDNGARLAFFMVWPSRFYYDTFDGVIENYSYAANLHRSLLCPVGKNWKAHFDATGDFSYYGPDDFHPSEKGSMAAAEIIFNSLFNTRTPGGKD